MDNILLTETEIRTGNIESDQSHYFSQWGSKHPILTIREEIDNQLAANPSFAGITMSRQPNSTMTIETFNDGDTPTPERMEKMKFIGRTFSDRKGASICGVGQIEGLVAGRKSPTSVGELEFKSINNGLLSIFNCVANGKEYTIKTANRGPERVDDANLVQKRYTGMKQMDEDDMEEIRILTGVKIYPYAKLNPDFKYTFNNVEVKPIDIMYTNIESDLIKRMEIKEYDVTYHGKIHKVKAGAVDIARYVKPDGVHLDETNANIWDKYYNLSPDSSGVFVTIGNVTVITGGKDSWNFIGDKWHSTHNGQNIWIQIDSDSELKDAIFAESPNKSQIGISLTDVVDYDGTKVFKTLIKEVIDNINTWTSERDTVIDNGKLLKKDEEEKLINDILDKESFVTSVNDALKMLSNEEVEFLKTKKFKTIVNLLADKNKIINVE